MTAHTWIKFENIVDDELIGGHGFRYKCTNCGMPVSVSACFLGDKTEKDILKLIDEKVEEKNLGTCELWNMYDVLQ